MKPYLLSTVFMTLALGCNDAKSTNPEIVRVEVPVEVPVEPERSVETRSGSTAVTVVSGAQRLSSKNHQLRLTVGGAAPSGTAASNSHQLRLGVP